MKYILLLTIFLAQFSYGQNCQNDSLFYQFKNNIQIELTRHNCVKWDDETRVSFYSLILNCSIENLLKHSDDSIPAIRCEIFTALAIKKADEKILADIMAKHKNDTARYYNSPTDLSISRVVNNYMETILNNKENLSDLSSYKSRLEKIQSKDRIIIPGEYHGIISKEALLNVDSLIYSDKRYRIVSFSLERGAKSISTNNTFTNEIKELIQNIPPGEFFYIENIRVEHPDKSIRILAPKRLEIK